MIWIRIIRIFVENLRRTRQQQESQTRGMQHDMQQTRPRDTDTDSDTDTDTETNTDKDMGFRYKHTGRTGQMKREQRAVPEHLQLYLRVLAGL